MYSYAIRAIAIQPIALFILTFVAFLVISLHFWIGYLFHQQGEEPGEAEARHDVEQETGIDVAATAQGDENLPRDGVADEEGGGDAARPLQCLIYA